MRADLAAQPSGADPARGRPPGRCEADLSVGGRLQARAALSQTSYYSHDDLRLHFGLGTSTKADQIEVRWPSGQVDVMKDVAGRRVVTIREGESGTSVPR